MNFNAAGLVMLNVVGNHFSLVFVGDILEGPLQIIVYFFEILFELTELDNKLAAFKLMLLGAFLDAANCNQNGAITLLESSCV